MIILSTKVTCSEIFMEKYQREGIEIEICQKSNLFYVTTNLNTLYRKNELMKRQRETEIM